MTMECDWNKIPELETYRRLARSKEDADERIASLKGRRRHDRRVSLFFGVLPIAIALFAIYTTVNGLLIAAAILVAMFVLSFLAYATHYRRTAMYKICQIEHDVVHWLRIDCDCLEQDAKEKGSSCPFATEREAAVAILRLLADTLEFDFEHTAVSDEGEFKCTVVSEVSRGHIAAISSVRAV